MKFTVPCGDAEFEIPDEWWTFCEAERGSCPAAYYPYRPEVENVQIVGLEQIEPPQRSAGVELFKKYKLVPVLLAFRSPECSLPPVEVVALWQSTYNYRVINGCHRYYASVSVGFTHLPVIMRRSGHAL